MTKINIKKIAKYWKDTADHDYETMLGLFRIKRYSDSLFFAHIALEKILKSLVVLNTKKNAPRIHDLTRLSELSGMKFEEPDEIILDSVNKYNIRSRYPDYKLKFYKLCDFKYTKEKLDKIKKIYKKICVEQKQRMK